MQRIEFNSNGEAIDPSTGRIIGRRNAAGQLVLNEKTSDSPKKPDQIQMTEQKKSQSEIIKKSVSYSKYEVRPDSEFTIRFCLGFKDERVVVYTEDAYLKLPDLERHWVKFRMWTFSEELAWKNQCMEYDHQTRNFKLNSTKLDEFKVRNLIKEWSFSEFDPKFKLLHVNKILSDESYDIFKGFFPSIINNIIFLMNQVLEQNG